MTRVNTSDGYGSLAKGGDGRAPWKNGTIFWSHVVSPPFDNEASQLATQFSVDKIFAFSVICAQVYTPRVSLGALIAGMLLAHRQCHMNYHMKMAYKRRYIERYILGTILVGYYQMNNTLGLYG